MHIQYKLVTTNSMLIFWQETEKSIWCLQFCMHCVKKLALFRIIYCCTEYGTVYNFCNVYKTVGTQYAAILEDSRKFNAIIDD